jgi:SAM-dependent methyltransferase
MRDLSMFPDGSFDVVWHSHSIVFVPDAARVIAEVARVLAPGGVYRASTMHPVTLRMYGTWTGTGWGFNQSYFEDGAVPFEDAEWEFEEVKVTAPTLEYGHRISDLINACAAAGLVVDGFWETTPGEISTKVPLRALSREKLLADRDDLEPGSDDALERYLPAFIEWRARKLSPPSSPSASGSATRTAARPPRASASRRAGSPTNRRQPPSR